MSTQTRPATVNRFQRHLFTVDDYHRMAEFGIFRPDARVELIEGEIIKMAPIGSLHSFVTAGLVEILLRRLAGRAIVHIGDPLGIPPRSEPQPAISLLAPREDRYRDSHPEPKDVLLVIEVSEATLAFDMAIKAPVCARNSVREVWVVDARSERVHVLSQPSEQGFQDTREARSGQSLAPVAFPDVAIAVDEILGNPR